MLGMQLAGALWRFWAYHDHQREGLRWLEAAIAADGEGDARARARALLGAGVCTTGLGGDYTGARLLFDESLALARAAGDRGGSAEALYRLGLLALLTQDAQAQKLLEESLDLFREQQDAWHIAWALRRLGQIAQNEREPEHAAALLEESLRLARAVGQPSGIAWSLSLLGDLALDQGDIERAEPLLEESLALARSLGDQNMLTAVLGRMGFLARQQGDLARAQDYFEENLARGHALGRRDAGTLFFLSCVALESGDVGRARTLATDSLGLYPPNMGRASVADNLRVLASVAAATGQPARAARLCGAEAMLMNGLPPNGETWFPAPHLFSEAQAAARAALGEAAFTAAWDQGAAMTREEVIAYALAATGSADVPGDSDLASVDRVHK
jgi:tetratricopeptide (TPR) repeat protein